MSDQISMNEFGPIAYNDFSSQQRTMMGAFNAGMNYPQSVLEQYRPTAFGNQVIKKESKTMAKSERGLYQVILVNPKTSTVFLNKMVICDKLEDVLLEADAATEIKKSELSISETDKIINFLGPVRKTRKNKNGEVEIVVDEEAK